MIHGGQQRELAAPGFYSALSVDETWVLSLHGQPAWTQLAPGGESPGARSNEAGIYDPVGKRMIVYGGDDDLALPHADLHALSLVDDPQWSLLEPSGMAPTLHHPWALYDADGQRMILVQFNNYGAAVVALELGSEPAWHTFCALGQPPGQVDVNAGVVLTSDGIFAAVENSAFRFDLATPYCD